MNQPQPQSQQRLQRVEGALDVGAVHDQDEQMQPPRARQGLARVHPGESGGGGETAVRTDKDATQTNAMSANMKGALQVSPEASAWLMTGTCQLIFGR
jgi:hypothetical protein